MVQGSVRGLQIGSEEDAETVRQTCLHGRRPAGQARTPHERYLRELLELAASVLEHPDGWEAGTPLGLLRMINIALYGTTDRAALRPIGARRSKGTRNL